MEEHMKLFGWGIMGTPKGRQQVNGGSNIQLDVSYDLPQDIGVHLPNPLKVSEFEPLYCLKRRIVGNNHSLGLAEYFPILEQGQTRAGTYFGGFVSITNAVIAEDQLDTWLSAVRSLSQYQTEHFVDTEKKSYRASITGQQIPAPKELPDLVQALRPLPKNHWEAMPAGDSLFVHCAKGKTIETLTLLLKLGLFYRYSQIFFSESEWISQQIRSKKIEQLTSEQLATALFWVEPYQQLVTSQKGNIQKMAEENSNLRHHQQQLVEERVNQVKASYEEHLRNAQARAEEAENAARHSQVLAEIGSKLVTEVGNNAAKLEQVNLAQFASISPEKNAVSQQLSQIQASIGSLSLKMNNLQQPAVVEENQSDNTGNFLAIILAILSFVLLIWAVWATFFTDDGSDKIKTLERQKTQLEQKLNNENAERDQQIADLKKESTTAQERLRELCSKLKDDKKNSEARELCRQ